MAAVVIFVIGQAGTIMLARNADEQAAARRSLQFTTHADDATRLIEERILNAASAVRGLQGLFGASDQVTRVEFHRFVETIQGLETITNLAFVKVIPTGERESLVAAVRNDTSLDPAGYPAFNIQPETTHPDTLVPVFIAPGAEGDPVFGYDLGTDPLLRRAIEKTRDTGALVATQGIDLVTDGSKGFLLMLPVYRDDLPPETQPERRSQFDGVVQAAIAVEDLIADLPAVGTQIEVQVFDAASVQGDTEQAPLLYRSSGPPDASDGPTARRPVIVGDRGWTLVATEVPLRPGFNAFDSIPTVITFTGTLLTLALALTAFTLVDGRERAFRKAKMLTIELQEQTEHLRIARDRAIEADRLKTAFLANMSHELRTPLTAVIGLSSVLLKETFGSVEPKQRQYLEMISTSGGHLLDIVDDMLDLARIEAGREQLALEEVDLTEVIESSVSMIRTDAAAKGVALSPPIITEPLPVNADRRRIQQVLLNLLSNAVKFTDRGGEAGIAVTTRPGEVSLTIWDTGIGIPADHLPRIFAPFHQVDSSLAKSRAGSGLGLALAKRLMEMHHGSLTVTSTEARGTEFTLTMPLIGHTRWPHAPEASPAPAALSGLRVLVAEDNEVNRLLMTDLLKLSGCEVLEAADGERALAIARSETPDLIVLDIMLPVMDGITVAKLLKGDENLRTIPIIAVTALAMPDERERIMSAGCDAYLAKPFTHDQYLSAVAGLIDVRARV